MVRTRTLIRRGSIHYIFSGMGRVGGGGGDGKDAAHIEVWVDGIDVCSGHDVDDEGLAPVHQVCCQAVHLTKRNIQVGLELMEISGGIGNTYQTVQLRGGISGKLFQKLSGGFQEKKSVVWPDR